jgi:RHS repeat-associated protein
VTLDGHILANAGTATYGDGGYNRINLQNSAAIDNLAGGTFTFTIDVPVFGTAKESFNNAGTLIRTNGTATGAVTFSVIALNNSGSVRVQSGTLDVANGDSTGSFTVAAGGTLGFAGGVQTLEAASQICGAGTVRVDSGGTAHFNGNYALGPAGTTLIDGGTADFSGGAPVTLPRLTLQSGTLTGTGTVIVAGVLNWTSGAMSGAGTTTVAAGGQLNLSQFPSLDGRTLINAGTATWSGDGPNDRFTADKAATIDNLPGATFTIANDRILGQNDTPQAPAVFNNAGTLIKTGGTGETLFSDVTLNNTGTLRLDSGTLRIVGDLTVDGGGVVAGRPGAVLALSDLFGNGSSSSLTGATRDADRFDPTPTVLINETQGGGLAGFPHRIEAMSQDLGTTSAGFFRNFAYDTLQVGDANSATYVKLVDDAHNSAGTGPEALYVNTLIVGQAGELDLNGLHVYARIAQILGAVIHGSVSVVPPGGAIPANASASGDLATAGQVDDWTIFGRAGQLLAATVHTGALGQPAPGSPPLNFAQVSLVDPSGQVVATASNSQAGADATIPATALPANGTYHIRVHSGGTGNYILSVLGGSANDEPVLLDQPVHGQLESSIGVDHWHFSALTGQQAQFHLMASAGPGIQFDLTGPGGFVGFSGLTADSPPVTLPTSGDYTLTVHSAGQQAGAYAFELQTPPIALTLGTPLTEPLAGSGQTQLFQVQVPAGGPLQVALRDPGADQNEIYAKFGAPPTRGDFDDVASTPASADQVVIVPQAAPGTWYILVYSASVPAPGSYTLTAATSSIFLGHAFPAHLGTTRDDILTLTGAGFDATTTVSLVAGDGKAYTADSVDLASPTSLTATFHAGAVPPGTYSVQVAKADGSSSELADAFTEVQGGVAQLQTNLVVPGALGRHIPGRIEVDYSNVGGAAMPAPLLLLTATQGTFQGAFLTLDASRVHDGIWNNAVPDGFTNSIQLLAGGATPGLLQPGESMHVPVYWAGWLQSEYNPSLPFVFHLSPIQADDPTPIDWSVLKDSLRPSSIAPDAWNALYPNLVAQLGSTWGQYVIRMDADATYLAGLGADVTDLGRLFSFEILQANGFSPVTTLATGHDLGVTAPGLALTVDRAFPNAIIGRNQVGPFGLGWWWADGWQQTLSVASDGTVVISDSDGSQRRFQPDLRGGYLDQPGDHATLTKLAGGGYTLTHLDGLVTAFRPDGKVDYFQDTNGNRITAGYTNGLLTSLTHSSGQSLQIAYNGAGRVETITDPASGRTTTYTYDATNEHLMTVTTFDQRTTTYTYDLGGNPVTENALLSVTSPDGTNLFYTYDPQGRLEDSHRDGGAEDITYSYGPAGTVAATDAAGGTTTDSFDEMGLLGRVKDALGHVTRYSYDSRMNLVQLTDAAGQYYTYSYDALGNLIGETDPLGHTATFAHSGPFNRLASAADQDGHTTLYGYDPAGNLNATTYADSSIERVTYDALGDPKTLTNRRGDVTQYGYDPSGRLASETFADGTQTTYHYDGRDNLAWTTDPSGTTTLTYDNIDQLKEVDYPGGLFLKYTYDAGGRRQQMVDQSGFTVNYTYDNAGRLWKLTDASGALIDQYTYYDDGRLKREDKGNGTYTTYEYDLAGELLHLVNHAPDGSVNSHFDYTYGDLGNRKTMTTVDGQWTYTYDAIGELTHAVFASSNPAAVPDQDLRYFYDPAGNRSQTIINGVTTTYVSNELNQYTSIGNQTLGYDADGNLVSRTDGTQTSTYMFNDLNQLVAASTPAGSFAARYDALGFRVATTHGGQSTAYLVDVAGMGAVVAESDAGSLAAHYVNGLGLTSRVDPTGTAAYYDFDGLGSTAGLSGLSGLYVNSYRYLPFGESVSTQGTIANPFTFVGEVGVMQDATGLDFMQARDYSADQGRFLSEDPLGLVGGGQNTYLYVANSPVMNRDPRGLQVGEAAVGGLSLGEIAEGIGVGVALGEAALVVGAALALAAILSIPSDQDITKPIDLPPAARPSPKPSPDTSETPTDPGTGTGEGTTDPEAHPPFGPEPATEPGPQPPFGPEPVTEPGGPGPLWQRPPIRNPDPDFDPGPFGSDPWGSRTPQSSIIPPLPPKRGGPGGTGSARGSGDPNDKIGPAGYGPQGFIAPGSPLPYRIDFQNDDTATAPAQRVIVTDQLDPNLDWKTFALTGVGFGDTDLAISPGSQHYQTSVDITENGQPIEVDIELGLNPQTGLITATFQTIDPRTQLPPDVLTGFLPPEDGTGRGKGDFTYVVQPRAGLPTGTQIRNVATVVFDANGAITTDQVDDHDPSKGVDPNKQDLITIDAGPPTSHVAPLPATEASQDFTVSWSGQDEPGGSGIGSYDVYVSDDDGPYTLWQSANPQTSATFDGINGHTYAFYSVATDGAGNVEATPTAPEANTLIHVTVGDVSIAVTSSVPESRYGQAVTFTATVNPLTVGLPAPGGTVQFQVDGAPIGAPVDLAGGQAVSPAIAALAAGSHTITALYSNDPNYHDNSGSASQAVDKALLTIAADAKSMTYGGAVPALSDTITGFVNGDGPSSLTSPVVLSTTATAGSPPGVYPITVDGAASPNYAITFIAGTLTVLAPPLVTMTVVQEGFNKKHQVTQVLARFSGPADAGRADATAAYRLTIAGKHGSFTARNARAIALASAAYSGATDSVALAPKKPFNLGKPVQLRVSGELPSGLTDALGRLIDGDRDGRPGGDAVAILSKTGASVADLRRRGTSPVAVIRAVDRLLTAVSRGGTHHSLITTARRGRESGLDAADRGRDDMVAGPSIRVVDDSAPKSGVAPRGGQRAPSPKRRAATPLVSARPAPAGPALRWRAALKWAANRFVEPIARWGLDS